VSVDSDIEPKGDWWGDRARYKFTNDNNKHSRHYRLGQDFQAPGRPVIQGSKGELADPDPLTLLFPADAFGVDLMVLAGEATALESPSATTKTISTEL